MRAIFFDANGVLYYREKDKKNYYLKQFLQKYEITKPLEEVFTPEMEEIHDSALRGQITQIEYLNKILKVFGINDSTILQEGQEAIKKDHGNITLFPKVNDTLETLKKRGFLIGIITDAEVDKSVKLAWFKEKGLNVLWDAYANSMELKTRKPDLRMFTFALEEAGVKKEEAMFVGHESREINAAKRAGLQTIGFNYESDVEADYYIGKFEDLLTLSALYNPE